LRCVEPTGDVWRTLLVRRAGSELLLSTLNSAFVIPEVTIPSHQRVAPHLNREIKRRYGLEVVSLFPLETRSTTGELPRHYHAAELVFPNCLTPKGTSWLPASSLAEHLFHDPEDFHAARQLMVSAQERQNVPRLSLARIGWFPKLLTWMQKTIPSAGLEWTGKFYQANASESFSLIRFATHPRGVWFKAVGEPNLREFSITQVLGKILPGYLPTLIAIQPDCNGWLAFEAAGTNLANTSQSSDWAAAARSMARLQLQSVGNTWQILDAGARDLRVSSLMSLIEPCFEMLCRLMREQSKFPPPALSENVLHALSLEIRHALGEFQELGLPDTVGHLDCNPANIIVSGGDCVFLDWAEAFVGPPVFTFAYLLEHLRTAFPNDSNQIESLTASFVEPWFPVLEPRKMSEALVLTPLLAAFAYLTASQSWLTESAPLIPSARGLLRSLARRMKRESDHLAEGKFR